MELDIYNELEAMAGIATHFTLPEEISTDTISRWQRLFDFPEAMAQELWASIAPCYKPLGFDKEAYEYSLTRCCPSAPTPAPTSTPQPEEGSTHLLKLDHLLTPTVLQHILALPEPPVPIPGHPMFPSSSSSSPSTATFIPLSHPQKSLLLTHLATTHPHHRPTVITRVLPAHESLCLVLDAPRLGFDATLPQNRPSDDADDDDAQLGPRPRQEEYTVWYFFYGSLGDTEVLERVLGVEEKPLEVGADAQLQLVPAVVRGGRLGVCGVRNTRR